MRKGVLFISFEIGLIFIAVVVSVMTTLFPIWVWVAGAGIFSILIPLSLYHGECLAWCKQTKGRVHSRVLRRLNLQPVPDNALDQADSDLDHFRACLPHVKQCRELIRPFASPLGEVAIGLQRVRAGGDEIIELFVELNYLTKRLKCIGYPMPYRVQVRGQFG